MLLRRKYIFESGHTKSIRLLLNGMLMVAFGLIAFAMVCGTFILVAENENKKSAAAYYKRPPDLIVVFTGDHGRIPFAFKKAREYKQSHILISGVSSGNTVTSVVPTDHLMDREGALDKIDFDMLELDYMARNTLENTIETLRYLRKNPGMKTILVISHDYHIMRIKTLLGQVSSPKDDYQFNYIGIPSDYTKMRNVKVLYKEVFKLLRGLVLVLFWDSGP